MRKLLNLLFIVLIIMSFSYTVQAIEGYIALDYNLMYEGGNQLARGGQGEIYLYKEIFNDRVRVAGRMKTDLMGFYLKGGVIPAGVPSAQTYDLEISYKVTDDITITLIEGCKHYFSQSGYSTYNDKSYIRIRAKYEL